MTYLTERESYGRTETVVDRAAIVRDLAKALGGTAEIEEGHYGGCRVTFADGLVIGVYAENGAKKGRARISAYGPRAMTSKVSRHAYPAFPEITVDASRPADAIARDVERRIMPDARAALAVLLTQAAEIDSARQQAERHAAQITAGFPSVRVTFKDADTIQGDVYANGGGVYLSGRMNSDGGLYIDRVGGLNAEQARAVLTALYGKA
jgi:hypothetical protein